MVFHQSIVGSGTHSAHLKYAPLGSKSAGDSNALFENERTRKDAPGGCSHLLLLIKLLPRYIPNSKEHVHLSDLERPKRVIIGDNVGLVDFLVAKLSLVLCQKNRRCAANG